MEIEEVFLRPNLHNLDIHFLDCMLHFRTNAEKSLQNKKRVIQMLFVVVLEFFICWTPLYIINTLALFSPQIVYQTLGYTTITYFQLLAYSSSCCNPITYCFMNRGFRKAFLNLFRCFKRIHEPRRMSIGGGIGTTIAGNGNGANGAGNGAASASVIVGNGATQFSETDIHRFQTQRLCNDSSNWFAVNRFNCLSYDYFFIGRYIDSYLYYVFVLKLDLQLMILVSFIFYST